MAQQASPWSAPARLQRSSLARWHSNLRCRAARRQPRSLGLYPRGDRVGGRCLARRRFGGVELASKVRRHLLETFPVGLSLHGLCEALRSGDLLQQKLLAPGHGAMLFDPLSHRTTSDARVCYGSGTWKGSKTPILRLARCWVSRCPDCSGAPLPPRRVCFRPAGRARLRFTCHSGKFSDRPMPCFRMFIAGSTSGIEDPAAVRADEAGAADAARRIARAQTLQQYKSSVTRPHMKPGLRGRY